MTLTPRELEILSLLPLGKTNYEIGVAVRISPLTVKNHVQNIMRKMGVCNRILAGTLARQQGIIPDPRVTIAPEGEPETPIEPVVLGDEQSACVGGLVMYTSGRVTVNGRKLRLPRREFQLLRFFVTHIGRTYNRDQLLDHVWGDEIAVEPRTVDAHIKRLRRALPPDCPYAVETVRQYGYRLMERS